MACELLPPLRPQPSDIGVERICEGMMRRRLVRSVTLAASIAMSGCTHPKEYPGLGYGPECQSARARALANPKAPGIRPASPTFLILPPTPIPASEVADTAIVDVGVNVYGRPEKGSVR